MIGGGKAAFEGMLFSELLEMGISTFHLSNTDLEDVDYSLLEWTDETVGALYKNSVMIGREGDIGYGRLKLVIKLKV